MAGQVVLKRDAVDQFHHEIPPTPIVGVAEGVDLD